MGICLLILSVLTLAVLSILSAGKDRQPQTADDFAVLEIYSGTDSFPQTEFDAMFLGLGRPSNVLSMSAGDSSDSIQREIATAAERTGSAHVILFAWQDACIPALRASVGKSDIAGVILLSPTLSADDAIELFGNHTPDVPVALVDIRSAYSTSLYERLSGEDTSLFKGLGGTSLLDGDVFISPDAKRYLSQRSFTHISELDRNLLMYLPQVRAEIGEFIGIFIMDLPGADVSDIRGNAAAVQAASTVAAAFLVSGLLLFFASIPRTSKTINETDENGFPEYIAAQNEYRRARKKVFLSSVLASLLVSASISVLAVLRPGMGEMLLACWPILYYAACDLFLFRYFAGSVAPRHIPLKRTLVTSGIGILFLAGVFLLKSMHIVSFSQAFGGGKGILAAVFAVVLFMMGWIARAVNPLARYGDPASDGLYFSASHLRQGVVWLPYAVFAAGSLISGGVAASVYGAYLFAVFLAGVGVRRIFRRTGGSEWLAAAVFSVFYTLLALV